MCKIIFVSLGMMRNRNMCTCASICNFYEKCVTNDQYSEQTTCMINIIIMKEQEVLLDQNDVVVSWHEKVCQPMQEGHQTQPLLVSIQDPFHLLPAQVFYHYFLFFCFTFFIFLSLFSTKNPLHVFLLLHEESKIHNPQPFFDLKAPLLSATFLLLE